MPWGISEILLIFFIRLKRAENQLGAFDPRGWGLHHADDAGALRARLLWGVTHKRWLHPSFQVGYFAF